MLLIRSSQFHDFAMLGALSVAYDSDNNPVTALPAQTIYMRYTGFQGRHPNTM